MENRIDVYARALAAYGEDMQVVVVLEELSECQKELCKPLRGQGSRENLAEEVADVIIMMEQMMLIFGIGGTVEREMARKVERLEKRLRGCPDGE